WRPGQWKRRCGKPSKAGFYSYIPSAAREPYSTGDPLVRAGIPRFASGLTKHDACETGRRFLLQLLSMRKTLVLILCLAGTLAAQQAPDFSQFIKVNAAVVALTHVRVIDGTGAAARDDQTLVISGGKIQSIGPASAAVPAGAKTLDLAGYSVMPGMVGMHEHLFYPAGGPPPLFSEMGFSFPRMYLAGGVTTARTGGSIEPYTDLAIKRNIDTGQMIGPKLRITGPYLEGAGSFTPDLYELKDADDARRTVAYWSQEGATSFKAYMNITRAELGAAIDEAHKHGFKLTGHLCSVTFSEAADLGIDNLEHGITEDTEFVAGKKPDECPSGRKALQALLKLDIQSAPVQAMVRKLVEKKVAVTSTLAVLEAFVPNSASEPARRKSLLQKRVLDAMSADARARYLQSRANIGPESPWATGMKKEMEFERSFVAAGGLLMMGVDPTGNGGALPGYGDQRQLE